MEAQWSNQEGQGSEYGEDVGPICEEHVWACQCKSLAMRKRRPSGRQRDFRPSDEDGTLLPANVSARVPAEEAPAAVSGALREGWSSVGQAPSRTICSSGGGVRAMCLTVSFLL